MSDLIKRYNSYSKDQLVKECIFLTDQNKALVMRLAAVKTIVNSINPACSEKLKRLIDECGGCEEVS